MKKNIFSAVVLVLFWGLLILVLRQAGSVYGTHEYLITKYYRFEMLGNEQLVQSFTPGYEKLEKIELFIANIYPETEGYIHLSILDSKDRRIYHKRYKASSIPTGEFHTYRIRRRVSPGEQYRLCLSYDGKTQDKPQIMVSERNKNLVETEVMYVKGETSEYNMAITYHFSGKAK